jgi:hypothetical protein
MHQKLLPPWVLAPAWFNKQQSYNCETTKNFLFRQNAIPQAMRWRCKTR